MLTAIWQQEQRPLQQLYFLLSWHQWWRNGADVRTCAVLEVKLLLTKTSEFHESFARFLTGSSLRGTQHPVGPDKSPAWRTKPRQRVR